MKEPVWLAVSFVFLIITYLFLHGELKFWGYHKLIDSNKFAAYGQITASLLTAATVYLLFKQNKQQLEDRKAANQPDLYPATTILEVSSQPEPNEYGEKYPLFYKRPKKEDPNIVGKFFIQDPTLTIHNLGLAAAKDVIVNWIYDEKEIFSYIHKNYTFGSYTDERNNQEYNFINNNEIEEIKFPSMFLIACHPDFNTGNALGMNYSFTKVKPALRLTLDCTDILDNKCDTKTFDVNFEINTKTQITVKFSKLKKD